MKANVHSTIKTLLNGKLAEIENELKADIFTYYGILIDGLETDIVGFIEDLAKDRQKRDKLVVILTTSGGSAFAVNSFNMPKQKQNIEQKMEELVKKNENKYDSSSHKKVAKANEKYNTLIASGIVEKRGYTLRGIEDIHLLHIRPNL